MRTLATPAATLRHARLPFRASEASVPWRGYAVAALGLGVAYFSVSSVDVKLAIYQVSSVGAFAAILVGVRRNGARAERHWWLFAAALALWAAGDAYWDVYRWVLATQAPFPSPADILYFAAYPAFVAGVFVLGRGWGRPQIGDVLDGLIVTVSAAALVWVVLLDPTLGTTELSWFGRAVAASTPVCDVLLLLALTQIMFRRRLPNLALRCLALGIAADLVGDVIYSYLNLSGSYTTGMAVDGTWLLFYALWGVAALHPSMASLGTLCAQKTERFSVWRIGLLMLALMTTPLVLAVEGLLGGKIHALALATTALATTLLVGARTALIQRERSRVQAALVLSEQRHRELFEEAEQTSIALAAQLETRRRVAAFTARLLAEVPDLPTPAEAESGLRRALGDPTLQLLHYDSATRTFKTADGRSVELPPTGSRRGCSVLEYDSSDEPLAALVYDPVLREDPEILDSILRTTRVAIARDRLQRELHARVEENDELRELDRLKDDLIALVSHELRTPLTSIIGYLELVLDGDEPVADEHRKFLGVVDRNADRLLRLVSDLLFVAQVQAGRLVLEEGRVSLTELVSDAVAAALPEAQRRSVELSVAAEDADVIGDRQRLAQVVDNVLSNALKFTPPGGFVEVRLHRDGDDVVVLEVADSGMGIPAAEQAELFTRFFRTEAAMKKAIQGTGLGLSIVKAIVEGHGGEITVESAEGEGATFRISLAAAPVLEPVEVAA